MKDQLHFSIPDSDGATFVNLFERESELTGRRYFIELDHHANGTKDSAVFDFLTFCRLAGELARVVNAEVARLNEACLKAWPVALVSGSTCRECGGSGRSDFRTCGSCGGSGRED